MLWRSRGRIIATGAVVFLALLARLVPAAVIAQTAAAPTSPLRAAPLRAVWERYEQGFAQDTQVRRSGVYALRCVNREPAERRGGRLVIPLNQRRAAPLIVTGWSRAEQVSGVSNPDYAVYVDLEYDNGTFGYGFASAFDTGTHDWQRRRVTIAPERPIKTVFVYALLRGGHTGTAWFDDFTVTPLTGSQVFDSQPLAPPRLPPGGFSGWFVRDVAVNGPLLALTPGGKAQSGLFLSVLKTQQGGRVLRTTLRTDSDRTRAVTLYYVERVDVGQASWWKTIRERETLTTEAEGTNAVTAGDVGATGTQTRYPFGCVTGRKRGRALALPPDLGPRIVRIGYHPAARLLYIAFDLALTPQHPAPAPIAVARYPVVPEWGLRDAARVYYALFPAYYKRRTAVEGIWMPFTDPATITRLEDFGIAWHEGDNSIASDDSLGILSFRYTEPMSYWMIMPDSEARDYDTALARLKRLASSGEQAASDPEQARRQALATLTSGSRDAAGKLQVEFRNAPWANGAVWTLNPNPRLPGTWTKARVNYDRADADHRYATVGDQADSGLDGEYLDSLEGWANVLDYGAQALRASHAPPTFAAESFRAVVPTWFSVWEFADDLRTDLRRRGKLLMGNGTPWTICAFSALLDAAGTETDWLGGDGALRPESDALMCWRRTLSGRKPYLLLMNTDFERFGPAVKQYFQRCLFYGIFPSFFSANAADKPYWENPAWYNRDRPLFQRYLPILKTISAAGWEPVTYARSSDPDAVWLERFGTRYLTVRNATEHPVRTTIFVDVDRFTNRTWGDTVVTTLFSGEETSSKTAPARRVSAKRSAALPLVLKPGETQVLQVSATP